MASKIDANDAMEAAKQSVSRWGALLLNRTIDLLLNYAISTCLCDARVSHAGNGAESESLQCELGLDTFRLSFL